MKFGKRLRVESNLPWNTRWIDFYVNYKAFKQMLKVLQEEQQDGNFKVQIVHQFISSEFKRCKAFLHAELKREREKVENSNEVENIVKLKNVRQLDRLKVFLNINQEAFRKILKKFNKKIASEVDGSLEIQDEHFQYLFDAFSNISLQLDELLVHWRQSILEPSVAETNELEFDDNNDTIVEDDIPVFSSLNLDSIPPESKIRMKLVLGRDGLGEAIAVPVIVLKGKFAGPTLGVTSALHGNELSGIPLLHNLINWVSVDELAGTLVAVPLLNPPGYVRQQREFFDGQDLNRLFPGKEDGNCGQVYARNILNELISKFSFHIDLHTASFGRVNSFYIRADMNNASANRMAMEQCSQIVVHNTAPDGSLRSAAMGMNIPSITLEIGDPQIIHKKYVRSATQGIENVLFWLNMLQPNADEIRSPSKPTICTRSYWIYAKTGGLLTVRPSVNEWLVKGQVYAQIKNIFGDVVATFRAPSDGIVVGKSTNPVCATGDRMIHFGVIGEEFHKHADDGHT